MDYKVVTAAAEMMTTDMTYISDRDEMYHYYLNYGIESVLMIADVYSSAYYI
ncbi:hypothetical protein [Ammoniphilus oxalaticus]|uniref:hypothetical protein n=1 Tax=Ammoniphilus oxalaticus TaxID=66863 RepID=UPI00147509DC|nr:hypothetical protein [Ammoniphilus oxalaticus]